MGFVKCNECGVTLKTVPAADLQRTLDEIELSLEVSTEICAHCGSANVFPGFSTMLAYTCRSCDQAVMRS